MNQRSVRKTGNAEGIYPFFDFVTRALSFYGVDGEIFNYFFNFIQMLIARFLKLKQFIKQIVNQEF